jgi:hypothetical protein
LSIDMKIRYSEQPAEWRKFTWASLGAILLVTALGAWRGRWSWQVVMVGAVVGSGVAVVAMLKPEWFRAWYRGGRWFGHQMGRVMGGVILTLVFVLVMTPLGLVLRLLGRDPLQRKWEPGAASYWIRSRQPGQVERLF